MCVCVCVCDERLYLALKNGGVRSFPAGCKTLQDVLSTEEPRVNCQNKQADRQKEDEIHDSHTPVHTHR